MNIHATIITSTIHGTCNRVRAEFAGNEGKSVYVAEWDEDASHEDNHIQAAKSLLAAWQEVNGYGDMHELIAGIWGCGYCFLLVRKEDMT